MGLEVLTGAVDAALRARLRSKNELPAVATPRIVAYMAGMLSDELRRQKGPLSEESLSAKIGHILGPFFEDFLNEVGSGAEYLTEGKLSSALHSLCSHLAREILKHEEYQTLLSERTPAQKIDSGPLKFPKPFKPGSLLSEGGFVDPCLGLRDSVAINFNAQVPLAEAIKRQTAAQRERQRQLRLMKEWEKSRAPLPPPVKKHGAVQRQKLTDIIVNSFVLSVAGRELLKDAQLRIVMGRKYGLIGQNGIGKSTLISAIVRKEIPGLPKDLTIGCVEQEMSEGDLERVVLDAVLSVDQERMELLRREKTLLAEVQTDAVGHQLASVYSRLEEIDAGAAEGQAASILTGLGFTLAMQQKRVRELSGGWRVRVALARALFATPDILCLDEPTNHLDLHAVAWLTDYLQQSAPGSASTCLIVSHARNFLNDVCTDVIDFVNQKLKYYRGDYSTYERVKAESRKQQQKAYEAQQLKREHDQAFIDRFRAKAATASMVQSRIKALERMPQLEAVTSDSTQTFAFSPVSKLPSPILSVEGGWYRYGPDSDWILKDVELALDLDSRIAVCGVNGCGKSTLLKILAGSIEPQKGICRRNNHLKIGYFSQYHVDQLDLTLNAVQQLQAKYPEADLKPEQARAYLGRFGVSGLLALEPLYILSGGQKSRAALAMMAFTNPHILVLDEPTNHLDLEAVQALITALNDFEGGVVVVSHDLHLLSSVVNEIYHVEPSNQSVKKYRGDVMQYAKDLLKKKKLT